MKQGVNEELIFKHVEKNLKQSSEQVIKQGASAQIERILNRPDSEVYGEILVALDQVKAGIKASCALSLSGMRNPFKKKPDLSKISEIEKTKEKLEEVVNTVLDETEDKETAWAKIKALAALVFKKTVFDIKRGATLKFDSTTLLGTFTGEVDYNTAKELIVLGEYNVSNKDKCNDVKPQSIDYEEIMKSTVLIAQRNCSFLKFVEQLEGQSLKFLLENYYERIKSSNKLDYVHLGENGCIEFAGALLLLIYSYAKNDTIVINACNEAIMMAFKGASPEIFSNVMDNIINEETNIPYEDWSAVYRYLKDNYGTLIRKIEFAAGYTMNDHIRYSKFIRS